MQGAWGFLLLVSTAVASTLTPPVLPLIVRNPYLSTWLADARNPPWHNWPMFYTGEHVRDQNVEHVLKTIADDYRPSSVIDWVFCDGLCS